MRLRERILRIRVPGETPPQHRRVDGAGRDRIDANSVGRKIHRHGPRQADDRALGGDIGTIVFAAGDRELRGKRDDRTLALSLHLRHRRARPEPGAADIGAEHLVPIGGIGRHHRAAAGTAAVINTSSRRCLETISATVAFGKSPSPTSPRCSDPSPLIFPLASRMASSVFCIPAASRSTSATNAPSAANSSALARPIPEPAPVTTAIRSFSRMSRSLPMMRPPIVEIGRGVGAAKACAPAEFLFHARYRQRRAIGFRCADQSSAPRRVRPTGRQSRDGGQPAPVPIAAPTILARSKYCRGHAWVSPLRSATSRRPRRPEHKIQSLIPGRTKLPRPAAAGPQRFASARLACRATLLPAPMVQTRRLTARTTSNCHNAARRAATFSDAYLVMA